jgi:hypothetical protein
MKKRNIGHTAFPRGKRVWVIDGDGSRWIDHFEGRNDHSVKLRRSGWIPKSKLRSISPYKHDLDRKFTSIPKKKGQNEK